MGKKRAKRNEALCAMAYGAYIVTLFAAIVTAVSLLMTPQTCAVQTFPITEWVRFAMATGLCLMARAAVEVL